MAFVGFESVSFARGHEHVTNWLRRKFVCKRIWQNMEANKATRRGGRYCVAGTLQKVSCKNTSYTPGIKMHTFPKDAKTRQKWVKFVQKHRVDFKELTKHSSLCSAHFEDSCYNCNSRRFLGESSGYRVLERGSIPTKDTSFLLENRNDDTTARGKREGIHL